MVRIRRQLPSDAPACRALRRLAARLLAACAVTGFAALAPAASAQIQLRGFGPGFGNRGAAQASGKPQVTVTPSARSLTMDDDLTVEIRYSGEYDRYEEPTFDGFEVADRQTSQQMAITGGNVSRTLALTVRLRPRRPGTHQIKGAKSFKGGAVVAQAGAVTVTVRAAPAQTAVSAAEARRLGSSLRQPYFLKVDHDRDSYYVGEPFLLTWNLYFKRDSGVESAEIEREPELAGLHVEELLDPTKRPSVRETRVGGQRRQVVPRSQKLAVGLEPGKVTIDAMKVGVTAGGFFNRQRKSVRSQPFELTILPVPTDGRPADFQQGAIGRFTLQTSLRGADGREPRVVQTGERLVLEVVVAGDGGLRALEAPSVDGGDAFDVQVLPSTADDAISQDASGIHGQRSFQFVVAPTKPGKHDSPTVRLSFFDPSNKAFETLESPGLPLTVEGRELAETDAGGRIGGEDVGPILEGADVDLGATPGRSPMGTLLFWLLFAAPLAAWVGVEGSHRLALSRAKDPIGRRSKGARAAADKTLALAGEHMAAGREKDVFGTVSRALVEYLGQRANLPATGMTRDELRAGALRAGWTDALVQRVVDELDHCDFARFAPSSEAEQRMRDTLDRATALLGELDAVTPEVQR